MTARRPFPHPRCTRATVLIIIDVLTDLLDKAQAELDDTRFPVTNTAHNFAMLKRSIGDQLAPFNNALDKDMADKSELATAMAALTAETAHPAEAQDSLAFVKASQAAIKSTCGQTNCCVNIGTLKIPALESG